MPGGHLGMLGGASAIVVPPPPDPDPVPSGWGPLQYDAPAGWENYQEIIVEPATGVDKNSDIAAWGVKTITLTAGQNRKIVMPMPGDFYGNTTHRKGKLVVNGGGNIVFCVKKADGTYRRGGFCIEMPKYTPYLATATAAPPSKERKALDINDKNAATDGRIVDVLGFNTVGIDNAEGVCPNGKNTHYQFQRSRVWAGRYRCAADRAGNNSNTKDGYSADTTNPYRLNAENVHCDCFQCYESGYKSLRIHDCTLYSSLGVFSFFNNTDWQGVAVVQGEIYLSRVNIEPFYFSTPETLNNFNTGYNNPGRNQATRWYLGITLLNAKLPMNHIYVDDDVYFGRNNVWDPGNGDPAWPGRAMSDLVIGGAWTVFDTAGDNPRRMECSTLGRDGTLGMRRWTRSPGNGITGTDWGTPAQYRIGDPPGGSYAPASMWGGDGNSYIE